jgi:hypothetical protein
MTGTEREWRSRAACLDVDAEIFFPVADGGSAYPVQVAAAKAVCGRCAVRAECLRFALAWLPEGVAGGLTPEERRGLRGHRRPSVLSAVELQEGPRVGAGQAEVAAAGLALLAAGRPVREVARRCGVTERTVTRWSSRARASVGSVRGVA